MRGSPGSVAQKVQVNVVGAAPHGSLTHCVCCQTLQEAGHQIVHTGVIMVCKVYVTTARLREHGQLTATAAVHTAGNRKQSGSTCSYRTPPWACRRHQ